jgi:2-oxoisovalerate dehydrogenase E1 component
MTTVTRPPFEEIPPGSNTGLRDAPTLHRGFSTAELIEDFRTACISRALDDRQLTMHKQGRTHFHIAGAGHEALLVAIARSLRPAHDWFFPYYRDLALALALGVTPYEIMLQAVGGADDPSSGGRQMPGHFGSKRLNIVTQSSPTGSQCIPAVGCAEAARYLRERAVAGSVAQDDEVTYVSIGDGATSEGEFWESLNTACTLMLPVIYLVADNGYAISVPGKDQAPAPISELVSGFPGLRVERFDGCDYFAARTRSEEAIASARGGGGPVLLHATVTRPYSHSSSDNQAKYRISDDLAQEAERDPILTFGQDLVSAGILTPEDVNGIVAEAHDLASEAAQTAFTAARPAPSTVLDHLLDLPNLPDELPAPTDGENVHFGEAIRRTLHEQMAGSIRIRVFGEDVADGEEDYLEALDGLGGVFGTTHGLQRAFGADRCYNTPLAEANIVGRAVGQALRGLHPSPEIQFFDYIWPAMTQIRSEAATLRWRSNGAFHAPMVLRCAIGGYVQGGAIWHSQCGESIFTHIPGLVVMFPSRARDAAGLLRAAFACDDPVLFLEHKHLFRQRYAMDPYPGPEYVIPLGKAATVRPGEDLTIVSWGATVHRSVLAATELAAEGIEAEVIDLRTLAPWDTEAVIASVSRTARLLVVHEDVITGGFGAEIAAVIADECFDRLDAPVRRYGALDTWVAYDQGLEAAALPQVEGILNAARALAQY